MKKIREQAIEQLGISISTEYIFKELSEALNPKNYSDDSEKLEIANEYYHQVLSYADNYKVLEDIKEEPQIQDFLQVYKSKKEEELRKKNEEFRRKKRKEELESEEWNKKGKIFLGCVVIAVLIYIIIAVICSYIK